MRAHWLAGVSSVYGACVLAELVAASSVDVVAHPMILDEARLVTTQGIADRSTGSLMPAALSEDGRLIAFVAQDRSVSGPICCQHVYTLDRSTGLTTLESISPDGSRANEDSQSPGLSSDGQILAFETFASNLVPGDMPLGSRRVVVRDRRSGLLQTPVGPLREMPNGDSHQPVVAGSGIAVAFTSAATNLVAERDRNGSQTDIYLWRLEDATITRVSVDSNGVQPSIGNSYSPTLSSDGKRVAFVSTAPLTPEDTNDVPDVYIRDLQRGVTSMARAVTGTTPSKAPSYWPQLSADGRYVAFVSKSANLAPRDRNHDSDVFVYEVATRSITLVSATAAGDTANAVSSRPAISADGRYVVFQSVASNLGTRRGCPPRARDENLLPDVYLLDRATGCVTRISGSPAREWWTPSVAPAISGSGKIVAFSSSQPSSEDDVTTDFDLFVYIRTESRTAPAGRTLSVPASKR
jgi:Tol biopolymer transport system component